MEIITTTFRCTNCWADDRKCDEHGRCAACGHDMHRPWPWNGLVIGCPISGKFHGRRCGHLQINDGDWKQGIARWRPAV